MLQWAFRIGLLALVAVVVLGAAVAVVDSDAMTDQRAQTIEGIGNVLVAVWFIAGVPLWVVSIAHLWRSRSTLSTTQLVFWGFFLLAFSLLTAFVYYPRFVRRPVS